MNSAPAQAELRRGFNPVLSVFLRVLLFILGLAVSFLPRRMELGLGPRLGLLYLWLDAKRRTIAYDNIRHCLPELGPSGWNKLLRQNFEHYGILGLELLHMLSPLPGHYRRYVQRVAILEGLEHWKTAHDQGHGVLCVSAHLANWELMAAAASLAGISLTIVTRHLKPEWLHKKIEAARLSTQFKGAYLPDTLPTILRALRKKETVGFVLDQYASPPMGIPVPFFGVKVDTLAAIATLAQRYGSPIVPVLQVREADGIVHIRFGPAMDLGNALQDPEKTTTILSAMVESWIRANPPQWLWAHRRFKNVLWPQG